MPGEITRKASVKRDEPRERIWFSVCQAISIAITVVLPAPVASFRAMRNSSGLASAFSVRSRSSSARRRHFRQPDRGLHRFDLAEEQPPFPLGIAPVAQELRGYRCDRAFLLRRRQIAPSADLEAQFVDVVVGLRPAVLRIEFQRSLRDVLMPRRRHRHNVFTAPASCCPGSDRDAGFIEFPVSRGFRVRAVQDRIVDCCHFRCQSQSAAFRLSRFDGVRLNI